MKVTDEMADKACRRLSEVFGAEELPNREQMRAALESALEDDIPVSEGILDAGNIAWDKMDRHFDGDCDPGRDERVDKTMSAVYRAMRRVEMEEASVAREGFVRTHYTHKRDGDGVLGGGAHRRKDDP